jgi:hypothetical protein
MSGLFSNLNSGNIQFPDAKINQNGPLPPTSSPAVHYTTSKINNTDRLLSGINAYDYGDHKYTSDDIAYQNIPVKVQKIIPEVKLPGASNEGDNWIKITHPVDDGDLAFVLKIKNSKGSVMKDHAYFERNQMGRAIDCIVNLPTINYILRGFQTTYTNNTAWEYFLGLFDTDIDITDFQSADQFTRQMACELFVRDHIVPFGVVIGSENQGGQHEGTNMAVDWPVNFVATICVDGFNENMVNLWRRCQVGAGDQLMLLLTHAELDDAVSPTMRPRADQTCNLNHYYKARVSQKFMTWDAKAFQLVPTTNRECDKGKIFRCADVNPPAGTRGPSLGMWHIATSQIMSNMVGSNISRVNFAQTSGMSSYIDDMQNVTAGALVQATVCPVWQPTLHAEYMSKIFKFHKTGGFRPGDVAVRDWIRIMWTRHNRPTFGAKLDTTGNHYNGLFTNVVKQCNNNKTTAHNTTIAILAHVIRNPDYVSFRCDSVTKQRHMQFTQKAHDLINGVQASAPITNTTSAVVNTRKPAVPLFQQVAAQQKAAIEMAKESSSLDTIASDLKKKSTEKLTQATPVLESRKRKGSTTTNSATALNTQAVADVSSPAVSRKVESSMQL